MTTFPGGKLKALTLSYDDDTIHDIRFAEIINRYNLKCTFNLNGGLFKKELSANDTGNRSMTADEAKAAISSPHEIATHGFSHPHYEELSAEEADNDIRADREALEKFFGGEINGHAYPFGTYDDKTIDVLEKNGIIYARTVKSTHGFELPDNFMTWDPTCHHKDDKLFELAEEFVSYSGTEPKLFYLWGHSYEFDRDGNWDRLEKFAEFISGRDDIWYCTNKEFYQWKTENTEE